MYCQLFYKILIMNTLISKVFGSVRITNTIDYNQRIRTIEWSSFEGKSLTFISLKYSGID